MVNPDFINTTHRIIVSTWSWNKAGSRVPLNPGPKVRRSHPASEPRQRRGRPGRWSRIAVPRPSAPPVLHQ